MIVAVITIKVENLLAKIETMMMLVGKFILWTLCEFGVCISLDAIFCAM
jgi:hypothetical protein